MENRYGLRMRKGFHGGWLGLALACAAWAPAQPPETDARPLALEDAIEQALAHNRDLVKGALDLQGDRLAGEAVEESLRGVRIVPEGVVGVDSDGGDSGAGLRVEKTGSYGTRVAVGAAARQIEVEGASDLRREEVRAEISQPLFRRFGPLVQNEPIVAANENLLAARRVWERDRSALVVRVVERYEGLIFLRHQIGNDEAFAARMDKLWLLADAREPQGKATRTEVMRMDLQRGEAAARLEAERTQLSIQFQEFADLLGLPLETAFRLVPPALLDLEVETPARALAVALAERPDYAQALQDIETGDRQLRIARRNLLPDMQLLARQTTFGEGEDWSDAGEFDEDDWFVGLAADMNVNLRGAQLDVARAGVDAESRRQVAEIVRNRLAVEVNTGLATYRRTRAELQLAANNRELAARRAELARALFEAGRASADSVSDAESDLIQAELSELATRREASLSAYRLLHVLGTLVPAPRDLLRPGKGTTDT
jgi:outer membrane protein TolC